MDNTKNLLGKLSLSIFIISILVFIIGIILYENASSTVMSLVVSGADYTTILQKISVQLYTGYAFMIIGGVMVFPISFDLLIAWAAIKD